MAFGIFFDEDVMVEVGAFEHPQGAALDDVPAIASDIVTRGGEAVDVCSVELPPVDNGSAQNPRVRSGVVCRDRMLELSPGTDFIE